MRTFLFAYLFTIPYLKAFEWGWHTIPLVIIHSYALLGIDSAASECEVPFSANRVNHLDMEAYCMSALSNVTQLVWHSADMQLRDRKHTSNGIC